jgi:acyl-CoA synthetase (NDP forming)
MNKKGSLSMKMKVVEQLINLSKRENRFVLTEIESKQILLHLGIPIPEFYLATSADEAVNDSRNIGFPVVLKIVSPEIIHKTDANGVQLNLQNEEEVRYAYQEIIANAREYNPKARIVGVSIQKMIKTGTEVIIGMNRDEVFGPVLLFGLGGIFVELLKDVSLKVLPITEQDIDKMFTEIQASKLLHGFRGSKPVDLASLKEIILKISEFSRAHPEISEFELNPVLVQEAGKGALALDARIILSTDSEEEMVV